MKKIALKIIYVVLAFFTRIYIKKTKPFVIGVTGNVGKSTCRMVICDVLQDNLKDKIVYSSPENFNSELGIIFSIFEIEEFGGGIKNLAKLILKIIRDSIIAEKKYDIIILEYGIDHPGDMDFLLGIVKPDISIFTKIGAIHVEYFGTVEKLSDEKFKLIANTRQKAYLNYDDEYLRNKYGEIKIDKQYFNNSLLDFEYVVENGIVLSKIMYGDKVIKTNILGAENYPYIELAFHILGDLGTSIDSIFENNEYFLQFKKHMGRFFMFKGVYNSELLDSSYNAGPESMTQMIENTEFLRGELFPDYKLGYVIGDMRELGDYSKQMHEKLYSELKNADLLITIGKETAKYFPKSVKNFRSSIDAGIYLKDLLKKSKDKYVILFKGSQNTIYVEEAVKQVLLYEIDENRLVRQSKAWMKRKEKFFKTID